MGPEDIVLHVSDEGEGKYQFSCPSCRADVEKEADPKIVALLVSAGVHVAEASPPTGAEPAFTLDDLIDLHFELSDDRALERFLQQV